jgi:tetratricopeptide (TPR) repeat protein
MCQSLHSRLLRGAAVALLLCLIPASSRAQGTPHDERNIGGTLINQDYFTADLYPEVHQTLLLVQSAHMTEDDIRYFNEGKYSLMIGDMKYTLDKFPNHPRALHIMCEISKKSEDFSTPIRCFEKALKLYPQHAYTHAQYGKYLLDIGSAAAGIQELQEALRIDPDLVNAQAWLLAGKRALGGAGRSGPSPSLSAGPPTAAGARTPSVAPRR